MGSMADAGLPYKAMYSGAKAFLLAWSTALAREMKIQNHNVEVLYIALANVTDTSRNRDRPNIAMPNSKTFAKLCLERVGCGEFIVAGSWVQGLGKALLAYFPERLLIKVLFGGIEEVVACDRRVRESVLVDVDEN